MWVFVLGVVFLALYLVFWFFKPIFQTMMNQPPTDYDWLFVDPNASVPNQIPQRLPFPSVYDRPTMYLSVIVPAYNEQDRITSMLTETVEFLLQRSIDNPSYTWEIIIVDDGSKDKTPDTIVSWIKRYTADRIRLLRLPANQGKGGAVQQGMLHARGQYLLMADADGATRIDDLQRLEDEIRKVQREGMGVVVGSRAHLEEKAIASRKWYRNILMHGFHAAVWIFAIRGIRDTQCGFKLFTRKAAQFLFYNQNLRRWSFDVELLYIARQLTVPIKEVSVNWTEIPGSKLNLVESSFLMLRDLVLIRLAYTLRIWKIVNPFNQGNRHLQPI